MYPYQTCRRGAKTAFSNTLTALHDNRPKMVYNRNSSGDSPCPNPNRGEQMMKGQTHRGTIGVIACLYALILLAGKGWAQGTWTWQQQCSSNEWSAICYTYAGCGYDQNGSPVHRYFNNWGLSQCGVSPGLPGPGSVCIFPAGANALLSSNVDILSVGISNGAVFSWQAVLSPFVIRATTAQARLRTRACCGW
jgi:hypothetical protein